MNKDILSAAAVGNLHLLSSALSNGENPNVVDRETGWSPLGYAIASGEMEICNELLSSGADPNLSILSNNLTPLMLCCSYGRCEIAKLLLSNGARTDILDDEGLSALDLARINENHDLVAIIENHLLNADSREPNKKRRLGL